MARLFLLLSLALLAPTARAEEGRYARAFTLWIGGVEAAELSLSAQWSGGRFRGESEMQTRGLLQKLYPGRFRAEAEGRLGPGGVVPARFRSDSAFGDERQKVTLLFDGTRPARVEAEPAFEPRPWQIDPGAQSGTLDPLAATLALLRPEPAATICNRSVDVFDGRRRTRISLGAPEPRGAGIACPAEYVRVAGFKPSMMKKQTSWAFTALFALGPDGLAEVVEISGETSLGLAIARRKP